MSKQIFMYMNGNKTNYSLRTFSNESRIFKHAYSEWQEVQLAQKQWEKQNPNVSTGDWKFISRWGVSSTFEKFLRYCCRMFVSTIDSNDGAKSITPTKRVKRAKELGYL